MFRDSCLISDEHFQDFGRSPAYLQRMRAEAAEEARRWEEEQKVEVKRKEAMKLSAEEKETIMQVIIFRHIFQLFKNVFRVYDVIGQL